MDREGVTKSALAIIIGEVLRAGIEQIAIVILPGDEAAFRAAAGQHAPRLTFIEQAQPLRYAHAVGCAELLDCDGGNKAPHDTYLGDGMAAGDFGKGVPGAALFCVAADRGAYSGWPL